MMANQLSPLLLYEKCDDQQIKNAIAKGYGHVGCFMTLVVSRLCLLSAERAIGIHDAT